MLKTTRTIVATAFILLLVAAPMASAVDQPANDAQATLTQAEAATVSTAVVPATQAPLIRLSQDHREQCGDVTCPPNFECCNPLEGICVMPGEACIL